MADLPPWLNINPVQNVFSAAEIGSNIGAKRRELGDQEYQQGAEMQFRNAQLAQESQMKMAQMGMELQTQKQEQDYRLSQAAEAHKMAAANLQLETQKAAVTEAEAKQRMDMAATDAARQYQQTQQVQQRIQELTASGMDAGSAAIQAHLENPWAVGATTGAESLQVPKSANIGGVPGILQGGRFSESSPIFSPPETITDPDGRQIQVQRDNRGQIHPVAPTEAAAALRAQQQDDALQARLEQQQKQFYQTQLQKAYEDLDKAFLPEDRKAAMARISDLKNQISNLDSGGGSGPKAGTDKSAILNSALASIAKGADKAAVSKRYKDLTGEDLPGTGPVPGASKAGAPPPSAAPAAAPVAKLPDINELKTGDPKIDEPLKAQLGQMRDEQVKGKQDEILTIKNQIKTIRGQMDKLSENPYPVSLVTPVERALQYKALQQQIDLANGKIAEIQIALRATQPQ